MQILKYCFCLELCRPWWCLLAINTVVIHLLWSRALSSLGLWYIGGQFVILHNAYHVIEQMFG